MRIARIHQGQAREHIAAAVTFTTSTRSLRGGSRFDVPGGFTYGYLPQSYWDSVDHADYVVMSYGTPIAWLLPVPDVLLTSKWVRPDVRYSVTTSKHQGYCPVDGTVTYWPVAV